MLPLPAKIAPPERAPVWDTLFDALVLALIFMLQSISAVHSASLPHLNEKVTVTGGIVRLGDLMSDSGDKANIALFRAPDPGTTGQVPVEDILELARQNGVRGIALPGFTHVSVTRSSRTVASEELLGLLREAFAKRAEVSNARTLQITLNDDSQILYFAENPKAEIKINSLAWSGAGGSFQAEIGFGDVARAISGIAQDVVKAVIATRDLSREAVLGPEDIRVEDVPRAQVNGTNILADDMPAIGKALRRPLRAGQVLNSADLIEPELVKRAAMVTLILRRPGMVLTARGQALRSGRRGEAIAVMNLMSKRMVEGIVTGQDEVTVSPQTNPLLQASTSGTK